METTTELSATRRKLEAAEQQLARMSQQLGRDIGGQGVGEGLQSSSWHACHNSWAGTGRGGAAEQQLSLMSQQLDRDIGGQGVGEGHRWAGTCDMDGQ